MTAAKRRVVQLVSGAGYGPCLRAKIFASTFGLSDPNARCAGRRSARECAILHTALPLRDLARRHRMRRLDLGVGLPLAQRQTHVRAPPERTSERCGAQHTPQEPLIGGGQIERIVEGNMPCLRA